MQITNNTTANAIRNRLVNVNLLTRQFQTYVNNNGTLAQTQLDTSNIGVVKWGSSGISTGKIHTASILWCVKNNSQIADSMFTTLRPFTGVRSLDPSMFVTGTRYIALPFGDTVLHNIKTQFSAGYQSLTDQYIQNIINNIIKKRAVKPNGVLCYAHQLRTGSYYNNNITFIQTNVSPSDIMIDVKIPLVNSSWNVTWISAPNSITELNQITNSGTKLLL